jgi:hypothetical protein
MCFFNFNFLGDGLGVAWFILGKNLKAIKHWTTWVGLWDSGRDSMEASGSTVLWLDGGPSRAGRPANADGCLWHVWMRSRCTGTHTVLVA